MERIELPRGAWLYDPDDPLGPAGGFGQVFAGEGEGHGSLAVKRIKLERQNLAPREVRVADEVIGQQLRHVIPTLDAGKDEASGFVFVVMARAEKSLQADLDEGKIWADTEAVTILLEIAEGLSEVPAIVHRDLKPANVLYHEGEWKIADFGIARFVEEATSPATLRDFLSRDYAAPEQWRSERATAATDIYALGCIGYAILTGCPPFPGPNRDQFRQQHLHQPPPALEGHDPTLVSLLLNMLGKSPASRMSLERIKQLLAGLCQKQEGRRGPKFSALAETGAELARRRAESEARTQREESQKEERNRLARDGFQALSEVVNQFFSSIMDKVPEARREGEVYIVLGVGKLVVKFMESGEALPSAAFAQCGWDVIAGASIHVEQGASRSVWAASLWYSKTEEDDDYRWREVSYWQNPLLQTEADQVGPLALDFAEADAAASPSMTAHFQIAYGPKPIDYECQDGFFRHWAGLLDEAAKGELKPPRSYPLRESERRGQRDS